MCSWHLMLALKYINATPNVETRSPCHLLPTKYLHQNNRASCICRNLFVLTSLTTLLSAWIESSCHILTRAREEAGSLLLWNRFRCQTTGVASTREPSLLNFLLLARTTRSKSTSIEQKGIQRHFQENEMAGLSCHLSEH